MKLLVPLMMPAIQLDPIGGQPFAQRLDDRNASCHRGLKRHHDAFGARGLEDFVAVSSQQRLVGRDHMLAIVRSLPAPTYGPASVPPINSTTMSMSGRRTSSAPRCRSASTRRRSRAPRPASRAATAATSMPRPARRVISCWLRLSTVRPAPDGSQAQQPDLDRLHSSGYRR
jgi:hypothetical protein